MLKLAVIVPVPWIVAVVLAEVELVKVIDPVLDPQDRNPYPLFADADMASVPEFSHRLVPEGEVVPAPAGETAKVT